jgi:hypothetical protein
MAIYFIEFSKMRLFIGGRSSSRQKETKTKKAQLWCLRITQQLRRA